MSRKKGILTFKRHLTHISISSLKNTREASKEHVGSVCLASYCALLSALVTALYTLAAFSHELKQ